MPVNQTPKKRRAQAESEDSTAQSAASAEEFGKETELDREKDVADAEWKNLWDQTEVIDMDTF